MIAHWDDVETYRREQGPLGATWTDLGGAAGAIAVGLHRIQLAPGEIPTPVHVHGDVRAGHVVARPAGSGRAHAFRAGEDGLTLLAYGSKEPNDICYYPRSRKVYLRGVGPIARLEHLDYWDGED